MQHKHTVDETPHFEEAHQFLVVQYILTATAYLDNQGLVSHAKVMAAD
jgi:hypothetical protein